jgi:DNA-directed RNA polymerase specialized sigma subunit
MWEVFVMTEHMRLKSKVQQINKRSTFKSILDDSMLNEKERCLMELHYADGKDFGYIADVMGYSKAGIMKMHNRALKKIEKLL